MSKGEYSVEVNMVMCCLLNFISPKIFLKTTRERGISVEPTQSQKITLADVRERARFSKAQCMFTFGVAMVFMSRSHCLFFVGFLLLGLV